MLSNVTTQLLDPYVPSRYRNPFATCWTKPGAIAYQFAAGESADALITRLASAGWWGEIRGVHGAGKTTLLASLMPRLAAVGLHVTRFKLHKGERHLSRARLRRALSHRSAIVVVDGYEQLSWLHRQRLQSQCRRAAAGLLVTSHTATDLPLLIRLQPDLETVQQLVAILTMAMPSPVSASDIAASHASHGSNVRECLFELYDRHERAIRATRTRTHCLA